MKAPAWSIRVTFANGRMAVLRSGGMTGRGPIVNFSSKEQAHREAAFLRQGLDVNDIVTVFERSHGRRDLA